MILRFGVENFCSWRDYTELSFIATHQSDDPAHVHRPERLAERVLPTLGVYGANASGKTNLLNALVALRNHVLHSFVLHPPGSGLQWFPWRMGGDSPTQLDVDFLHQGVRHHYGLRYDAGGYREEWLHRWPQRHRQELFHRGHAGKDTWHFGRELGGARKAIRDATRDNALFLSAGAQFNHEILAGVARSLVSGIVECAIPVPHLNHRFPVDSALFEPRNQTFIRAVLGAADLGIVGLRGRSTRDVRAEALSKLGDPAAGAILEAVARVQENGQDFQEVWLQHGGEGEPWELPPLLESHGTRALLWRLHAIIPALVDGGLLVIDEIEAGLHPDVCAAIVRLFTDPNVNSNGAQLLFTTHQRELLGGLRRDEVVLADKGRDGASTVRVASDFRDLRRRDDLRTVHAQGRIGGVPVLGDLTGLAADFVAERGL